MFSIGREEKLLITKIHLFSILDGIDNLGFRKFAAFARSLNDDTEISFLVPGQFRGLLSALLMKGEGQLEAAEVSELAAELAKADLVGFSSMTGYAHVVTEIIAEIRRISPKTYIIWGGIHPIMEPENAIQFVDAICTGEGEFAFEQFYKAYVAGKDYLSTPGFWFNTPSGVIKNQNLSLMTSEMMSHLPFQIYHDGEKIYKKGKGLVPITTMDFVKQDSLAYPMFWTIGCPFKCTYCGNSKLVDNDPAYRKLRHPSVLYVINEIKRAINKNPHISTIQFYDDSFMALRPDILRNFAEQYKAEIGLPFVVNGAIPNYVSDEKVQILTEAGMNRVRMGIQSGSQRILDFYKRPTTIDRIQRATKIFNKYVSFMIPPAYDIILDNPIEKTEDTLATLDLIYNMPRPFTLNIFSLRVFPNTVLAKSFKDTGIDTQMINSNYFKHIPSFGNCLLYLLTIWKIPRPLYSCLRRFVKPAHEDNKHHYVLMIFLRLLYLVKRASFHLRFLEFTNLPGVFGYIFYRLGIIRWWRHHMVRRFSMNVKP